MVYYSLHICLSSCNITDATMAIKRDCGYGRAIWGVYDNWLYMYGSGAVVVNNLGTIQPLAQLVT